MGRYRCESIGVFLRVGRSFYKIVVFTSWLVWGGFVLWCQSPEIFILQGFCGFFHFVWERQMV